MADQRDSVCQHSAVLGRCLRSAERRLWAVGTGDSVLGDLLAGVVGLPRRGKASIELAEDRAPPL